jgi:hypothetical protein
MCGETQSQTDYAPGRRQSNRPRVLASTFVAGVRQAFEAYGAELHYLPPYSPDLNPIENAFAKLKTHLPKSAARRLVRNDVVNGRAPRQFERPLTCDVVSRLVFGLRFTRPAGIHFSRKLTSATVLT